MGTVWKFQDFSTTQILCEIHFGQFEAPKTSILTILTALNVKFFQKSNFKATKMVNMAVSDLLKSAKIDLT